MNLDVKVSVRGCVKYVECTSTRVGVILGASHFLGLGVCLSVPTYLSSVACMSISNEETYSMKKEDDCSHDLHYVLLLLTAILPVCVLL